MSQKFVSAVQRHVRSVQSLKPSTLVAFTLMLLPVVAHAQGTMDFSGAQTLMGTFKTFAMYAGAVICLGGLIFAGIRMMSGRFQDAAKAAVLGEKKGVTEAHLLRSVAELRRIEHSS